MIAPTASHVIDWVDALPPPAYRTTNNRTGFRIGTLLVELVTQPGRWARLDLPPNYGNNIKTWAERHNAPIEVHSRDGVLYVMYRVT